MVREIRVVAIFLTITLLFIFSGCGRSHENSAAAAPKQEITAEGKYDPAINLVSVKAVDATVKFLNGDDIHNNIWTRTYKEKLGINLSYMWVVDMSQYQQKLSATIMSGDMPDAFPCNLQLFRLLYDSGLIEDITGIYQQHASAVTRTVLEKDKLALPCATIEGKLMGIPLTDASIASAPMLWVRRDWMRALNIDPPETMQDVLEISARFVNEDPDKNGQPDTVGLAVSKELWPLYGGLQGFFNGFHAYPLTWYERDGSLVYGTVQPEMKQALAALQEMYARGEIDKEFAVKDVNKVSEAIANSKCGLEFGVWWNPYSPLYLSQANYPDAYWQAYPIPSVDEKPAKSQYAAAVNSVIVIRKGYEYPEAVVKMLNFWCDNILDNPDENTRNTLLGTLDNPDVVLYKYTDFHLWDPNAMLEAYYKIRKALAERNPVGLNLDESTRYQVISAYFEQGIKEAWVEVATYGDKGSVSILESISRDRGMPNAFYGAPAKVMSEKMPALVAMADETITKIIMGEPLDSFDEFVEKWKRMGGDEITAEVNEWRMKNN
jgi:putative aldouronate transport system substrate-binding protein